MIDTFNKCKVDDLKFYNVTKRYISVSIMHKFKFTRKTQSRGGETRILKKRIDPDTHFIHGGAPENIPGA